METFKKNLEEFAVKYKDEIKRDAQFRKQFQDMCANIGVDPLASSKGFWSEILVRPPFRAEFRSARLLNFGFERE